jgi:hypothetical protein
MVLSTQKDRGMKGLTAKQVGDLLREFGFNEVEVAGLFHWYVFPHSHRYVEEQNIPAYVRAQFYEGRSDLQLWVVRVRANLSVMEEGFSDYVRSEDEVVEAVRNVLATRQHVAVEELVKWRDPRVPDSFYLSASSPHRKDRLAAERVLAGWLLENGVPF